jgi:transcriptional regulator with PAS, ATPase and Fis domain
VGELSARAQAKLLRVLQESEIRRIGENFTRPIDARLIAATNRSLGIEAQAGRFRQDLLYRLDVIRIAVPPLRDRIEDIPLLAGRFWREAVDRMGSKAVLGQAALAALARYDWPGNVRELQNVMASLAVSGPPRGVVPASAMPAAIAGALKLDARETLDAARRRFEERFVRAALARAAGHRGQTASSLGVSRQGLAKMMQRLRLP